MTIDIEKITNEINKLILEFLKSCKYNLRPLKTGNKNDMHEALSLFNHILSNLIVELLPKHVREPFVKNLLENLRVNREL